MLFNDLLPSYLLLVILSLAGLWVGSLLTRVSISTLALLIPEITAGVAGLSAFDIIRRSRSNLLLNGAVPEVGAGGILLGCVCAIFPLLIQLFLTGWVGLLSSALASLALAVAAFVLAMRSYHKIDLA
jgi:hypothetical protein